MNRDSSIDLVRTLGIIAIVAGHVWAGEIIDRALYSWHVPVFFFLTGYLWRQGRSIRTEMNRRAQTLMKPYLFWFAILYVVHISIGFVRDTLTAGSALRPLYGGFFATQPFTTFWFVFALFAAAVLWRVLELTPLWMRIGWVIAAIALAPFVGPLLARTPLAVGSAVIAVVFIAAGQIARQLHGNQTASIVVFGLTGVAVLLLWTGYAQPLDIKQGDWGSPGSGIIIGALFSWALLLVCQAVVKILPAWLSSAATGFALTGFTIVLVHPLVLWLTPDIAPPVVLFALALLVPLVIGYVLRQTRLSGWATGTPQQRSMPSPALRS